MNANIETGAGKIAARLARIHAVAIHPSTQVSPDTSPFIGSEAASETTERDRPGSGMVPYTKLLGGTALEAPYSSD